MAPRSDQTLLPLMRVDRPPHAAGPCESSCTSRRCEFPSSVRCDSPRGTAFHFSARSSVPRDGRPNTNGRLAPEADSSESSPPTYASRSASQRSAPRPGMKQYSPPRLTTKAGSPSRRRRIGCFGIQLVRHRSRGWPDGVARRRTVDAIRARDESRGVLDERAHAKSATGDLLADERRRCADAVNTDRRRSV